MKPVCRLLVLPLIGTSVGLVLLGCARKPDVSSSADVNIVEQAETGAQLEPQSGSGTTRRATVEGTMSSTGSIEFKDEVQTNIKVPERLAGLEFIDTEGNRVSLQSYLGKKNVVLVFTKGFFGMLCPFCTTQTSRLVANYEKFRSLDAEVLVVFPGSREHLDEFIEAAKTTEKRQVDRVPFPIVLDEQMGAVDFFGIRSELARPSTYIIDKRGNVRLAYVSSDTMADRPSVRAMLSTLEAANAN